MHVEDRIVHFSAELIHRPAPTKKDALQKLYFDLSQDRSGAYDNIDLSNPMQARFHSRKGKKTQSLALFLPDRVLLVEEWTDLSMQEFVDRLRTVGAKVFETRGVDVFLAHTITLRSTFSLTHFDDARVFLLDHACAQEGRIAPHLQRPIATGGLRFVLPETNEHPGTLNVSVESFRHSRNEVFVEVKGIFGRDPVGPDRLDLIENNMRGVRAFISDRIFPYLNQFDQAEDPLV